MTAATVFALLIGITGVVSCPDGFHGHNNGCYFFSHDTETLESAYLSCKMIGADLVTINNAAEDSYIRSTVAHKGGDFYIGLTDKLIENQWRWLQTNQLLSDSGYKHWKSHEPDNRHRDESCVLTDGGGWFDVNCELQNHYICETLPSEGPDFG